MEVRPRPVPFSLMWYSDHLGMINPEFAEGRWQIRCNFNSSTGILTADDASSAGIALIRGAAWCSAMNAEAKVDPPPNVTGEERPPEPAR